MSTVDELFTFIEDQGLAGGSTEWTLLRRRIMDAPANDRLVVVTEDGGLEAEIAAQEGIGDAALADPAVMVTVRAEAWNGDATAQKAAAIFAALHGRQGTLISGGASYLRVRAQTPEPVFAGYDERGRPMHTVSFRLLRAVDALGN